METFWNIFIGFLMGSWLTALIFELYIQYKYEYPMEALSIERFQKCEIHTTNCHSNWYEIVWKKEKQK